jgi:hypothetical protein
MTYTVNIVFPSAPPGPHVPADPISPIVMLAEIPVGCAFTPIDSTSSGNPPIYIVLGEPVDDEVQCILVATGLTNWLPQTMSISDKVYSLTVVDITAQA